MVWTNIQFWETIFQYLNKSLIPDNSSNPPGHVQHRSPKFFRHNSDPWFISFRSSHKSPQSDNPLETRSGDRQTDRRTDKVRTIALFSKGKFAKNRLEQMSTKKRRKKKKENLFLCSLRKVDEVKLIIFFISEMISAQTFFFSSSKNCRKFFSDFLMIFLVGKLLFSLQTRGGKPAAQEEISAAEFSDFFDVLSFAQFLKCGPQTDSGWPPLLQTDSQGFFL